MVPQYNTGQDTIPVDFNPLPPVSERDVSATTRVIRYEGIPGEVNPLHADWITMVILGIFIIYAIVATFARHIFSGLARLMLFMTPGSSPSDPRSIFQWQATLANFASFASMALFLHFGTIIRDGLFPLDINGILRWMILLAAITILVTLRHLVTLITGFISDNIPVMTEYLNNIYMLYRLMGIILLPLAIGISFSPEISPDIFVIAGFILVIIIIIVRIIRLLTIFTRYSVPILYFLLYLCALEILPGAILIRMLIPR
jgi:hypothetical protein